MFPIETATARDVLTLFFPKHDGPTHSMDGARILAEKMEFVCSCGKKLLVTADEVEKKTKEWGDDRTWKLGDLALRMKKICQVGRPERA